MKKIRILALILALLMLPLSILVGCKKPDDEDTDPSECKHRWSKYTEISARDCVTPLVRERTCTKCGEKEVDTKPAYGHTLTVAVSDNNASCTEDGTKTSKCGRCDYKETVTDVGSALGHTFPDSRYTVLDNDEFVESAVCVKCEAKTDYRLLGLNIDFEGDQSHLSYTKLDEYFVEGAGSIKTEIDEGDGNAYYAITRDDSVFAGSSAFGLILTPRADMLKGTTAVASPYYVVEYDIRISKTETKDLILLSGTKKGVTENFIKYNSEDGTIVTPMGAVYSFKDGDYDRWVKISVVLNDGSKEYTVYVDGYQLTFNVGGVPTTEIPYSTVDGYYLGYDLENFKIGLVGEVGVASKFDIDNICHYLGSQPKGYEGSADAEYFIYTTSNGDKIVYKIADASCSHVWGDTTVVDHTCISTGYSIHTCSVCGGQEIFDISTETLGAHNFQEVSTTPATCTEPAFRSEQCTKCGLKNGEAVGSPLGHEIDRGALGTVIVPPTCTEKGYTVGSCIRCNKEHKVDFVDPTGHEIDMTKPETYEIHEPTCLEGGYTIGKCMNCDVDDYITDETEPIDHLLDPNAADYVKVVADCLNGGYEESTCGREGCSEKYRTNETEALGHSIVSEIKEVPVEGTSPVETKRVIFSKCTRCADADSQRDVSTEVPDHTELVALIGEKNMLGINAARLFHFDGDDTPAGTVYGDDTATNYYLSDSIVARFSEFTVKTDSYDSNNRYMEWLYSPKNGFDGNGVSIADRHSYFDVKMDGTEIGKDVTLEISLRIPDGATEIVPIGIEVMDRSKMHFSGSHDVRFVKVDKNGAVALVSGQKIAQLTQQDWTRLGFVFHTTNATYDVYVDGVMIEKNVMLEVVDDKWGDSVKPAQKAFEVINGFRISVMDSTFEADTRRIDIDEVYSYYASVPAYVTDVKLTEKSGMSAFTTDMNTLPSLGYDATYLSAYSFYNAAAQRYTKLVYGNNSLFFVDGDALHLLKNSSVTTIPDAVSGNDAYIDINLAYGAVTNPNGDLVKMLYQYKRVVFEAEFTVNEDTADFTILSAYKTVSSANKEQVFLTYTDGKIVSGTDIISEVTVGQKHTVAVVFREDDCNYDIYVDGYMMREKVSYNADYSVDNINSGVVFRAFHATGNADIFVHSINVYGGKETPLLNLGRASFVKVDGKYVTHAIAFTEDYDYSVHYSNRKKANGDYVYVSSTSTLTIISGLENPENDHGLGLIKVDKDGNTGDAAVNEPVWALKTGDWGDTSNGEALKFYPQNVPMSGEYYDLTGYESLTFKYYVAESEGYRMRFAMYCPNNSGECYYSFVIDIQAGYTGWVEHTVPFSELAKTRTVSLDTITDIKLHISGWDHGTDKSGAAGNGTTLYIAGIDFNSKTTEKMVGMYFEGTDTFCGEGNHVMSELVVIEPSAHLDGYSYKYCTVDNCGYIELVEEREGTALGHVASGDPRNDSVAATCGSDGKLLYDMSCDICSNTVLGSKTYKIQHNWVKNEDESVSDPPTCTEGGYYMCTCDSGCSLTARLDVPALGHTKDETVDTIVVEPDCENGGYTQDHCAVCGLDYIHDETEPLDHTRDAQVLEGGGCEEILKVKYTCSRCDWEDTVITDAPGHSLGSWQTITVVSCGDGLERRTCSKCDYFEENIIEGTGLHDYETTTTPADCVNDGERTWTCTVCGDTYTEVLPATNTHTYGTELVQLPSAEAEGYTYYECSVCGYHNIISTTPATFEGTQDLKFVINGDIAVIEKYTGSATDIVVPATYAGKRVVISKDSFSGNTAITSITLSEGITEIGVCTFEGCTSLEMIVIPVSVTKIDIYAFNGCDALITVNYAGAEPIVAGGDFKAIGNDKLFDATWVCNYGA